MADLQERFWDNLLDYIQECLVEVGVATETSAGSGVKRLWRLLR